MAKQLQNPYHHTIFVSEQDPKDFIDGAAAAMGITIDQLAERLDYKSLRRIRNGEFPLPDSKRRHIADLVKLQELQKQVDTRPVEHFFPKGGVVVTNYDNLLAEHAGHYVAGARGLLQRALADAGMTPSALAKRIGYKSQVIEELVNGRGRISMPMAEKIHEVLPAMSVEELIEGSDMPRVFDTAGLSGTMGDRAGAGSRLVPLISEAQAGPNAAFTDDAFVHEGIPIDQDIDDRMTFALQIRGDSMETKISEGDRVIVCPSWEPVNGDIVITRLAESGDVMCKIYQTKSSGKIVVLSSYNPAYPPRDFQRRELDWIFPVAEIRKRTRAKRR